MEKTYYTLFENKRKVVLCGECTNHLAVWMVRKITIDVDKPLGHDVPGFDYYCNKCLPPNFRAQIKQGQDFASYTQGDMFNDQNN